MATGKGANGPTKRDRREEAREHARLMREEARKRAQRRKWWLQGSIVFVVIAILAVVGLFVYNGVSASANVANPKNMVSNGILLTSTTKAVSTPAIAKGEPPTPTTQSNAAGKANITMYVDYQCPYCNQFETANATQIGQWLNGGIATVEIHPIAILDASSSGTKYSTRAANAAACVANYDPNKFYAVNSALFANQPAEGGTGLTDSKILSVLKGAGASSSAITKCVNNQTFKDWVSSATTRVLTKPLPNSTMAKLTGTPTVIVNGQQYTGSLSDANAFLQFVGSAVQAASSTSSPTPTPTPTPSK
ncbi:DsbA family protein [Diaminobutyricibacter sp. McL0608]|uniref:DsbA family protein n=1 Tax=Leifsonia sp. McL0608 TaxID=3143537 RepID=UPI0031F316BC